jgi:hypothetical protein
VSSGPVRSGRGPGRALVVAVLATGAVAVAGCAVPGSSRVDGPVLTNQRPLVGGGGDAADVSGTVGLREGCLVFEDGADASLVVWPGGTRWDADEEVVILPGGARAGVGDEVSGGGGWYTGEPSGISPVVAEELAACAEATGLTQTAVLNPGQAVRVR